MDIERVMKKEYGGSYRTQTLANPYLHVSASTGFAYLIYLSHIKSELCLFLLAVFLFGTTLPILWQNKGMILVCILVAAAAIAFPPLAPLAAIFVIWLFIRRIELIITHWRPMLVGLFVYLVPIAILFTTHRVDYEFISTHLNIPINQYWNWPLIWSTLSGFVFNFVLIFLYRYGYSTKMALSLMGIVPMVLLALVLPFLKIPIEVGMPEIDFVPEGPGTGFSPEAPPATGYHAVGSHIRTLPDGILENNMSYSGDSHGTPPPAGYKEIKSYWRSNPDGIAENNLSYKGGVHSQGNSFNTYQEHPSNVDIAKATSIPDTVKSKKKFFRKNIKPKEEKIVIINGQSFTESEVNNSPSLQWLASKNNK